MYGPSDLAVTSDYRDVLGKIIQKHVKNTDLSDIFPDYNDWNDLSITRLQRRSLSLNFNPFF